MEISYKKLWHILLDKNMKKKDLQEAAGISNYAMRKLNNNEDVSVSVLGNICRVLDCQITDIMDMQPPKEKE